MDFTVPAFAKGIHNLLDAEIIPKDAAQDALGFVTKDGREVLVPGRELFGPLGAVGATTGFHKGFKQDGTAVIFVKMGTAIKYWDGSAWQNSITGLNATDEYTMANYTSLAGNFVYVNGPGAYYKIVTANPADPINVYDSSKNFYGYILIDRGRSLLWNRDRDKTGLYGSWIDRQNATVYTTVSGEAIGVSGSTNYTGTLAFKGGGSRRSAFGVSFSATTGPGTETFTDSGLGTLTSNFGGTGTINYATGAYNITFNSVTTGSVTSGYLWEDSGVHGVSDFSHTATRLAGEGFQFPQDEGGDPILNVLVGEDGAYYSIKQKSAWRLSIDADDLGADNNVYRKEMGLPFFRASIATDRGILFINTANPTKPKMTILEKSKVSLTVEPRDLFKHFKFANYEYDSASFGTYDRWVLVHCRTPDSPTNNRTLMCNITEDTVNVAPYSGKMSIQDGDNLYVADSVSYSVYSIFSGFDDMQSVIDAYWIGRGELAGLPANLKKVRKLKFKGRIDRSQKVGVYMDQDGQGFEKVGTILGSASYVSSMGGRSIGSNYIGEGQIGGSETAEFFPYFMEIKVRTPKFRKMTLKLVPEGYGYFDFDMTQLWDVLAFENRLPKAFRQKQNVSLDGTQTDQ